MPPVICVEIESDTTLYKYMDVQVKRMGAW